jgi:osmoprotectant transport system permease protein
MSAIGDFWTYVTTGSNWTGSNGLLALIWAQIWLSALATLGAAAIAVPLGVVIGHGRRGGAFAASVVNIGRALPSFAVLVLAFGVFSTWGKGLTVWPTFIALVLLGIPPMFTNTYTGVRGVDPAIREAATGMGLPRRDVVLRVEAPIALPLIITGVRVSAVQIVATATLGAWVGFQCLGTLIFEGFAQQDNGKILTGAIFVGILTIVTELVFALLLRTLTPWQPRPSRTDRRSTRSGGRRSGRTGPSGPETPTEPESTPVAAGTTQGA